ncbi:MAG TPA: hypothetical protein VMH20_00815 [Verrucomicrobiae bacterium]|nr:hypothetical protein [Verrucomicrobiae bacterium]
MSDIDDFVSCHGRKAAHRVNLQKYVSGAPNGNDCFTKLADDLLLCDSCTAFWLQRQGARDIATLEKVVKLRKATTIAESGRT